jgi:hypothetical protein
MARLLGPDTNGRFVYAVVTGTLRAAAGLTATVYSAATGSTLANIATYDGTGTPGATISGSTLTVDSDSLLPRFWFPDPATDTVWVSVNGGTRIAVNADADARLDTYFLDTRPPVGGHGVGISGHGQLLRGLAVPARHGLRSAPAGYRTPSPWTAQICGWCTATGSTTVPPRSPNYNDTDGTAVVQIKASVEISSVIYRVTFGGSVTGTMDGGGMLVSDPLPLDLTPARSSTPAHSWPAARPAGTTTNTATSPAGRAGSPPPPT